jgi:hypothetical protein
MSLLVILSGHADEGVSDEGLDVTKGVSYANEMSTSMHERVRDVPVDTMNI